MDGTGLSLAVRSDMFESSNQSTDPIDVEGNSSGADGDSACTSKSCIVFVMLEMVLSKTGRAVWILQQVVWWCEVDWEVDDDASFLCSGT